MPQAVQPDRLLRDELQAYQRRALRDWKADVWLAEHRPRQSLALDTQAANDVVVDIGGGGPVTDCEPGAVCIGTDSPADAGSPTPYHTADIPWYDYASNGLPAETRTIDRLVWPVDRVDATAVDRMVVEVKRVLAAGGLLVLRGRSSTVAALTRRLVDAGWTVERELPDLGHARIHLTESHLRLSTGSTPLADAGPVNIREVVLGETIPESPRRPLIS